LPFGNWVRFSFFGWPQRLFLPQRQTLVCIGSKMRSSILSFQMADPSSLWLHRAGTEGPLTVRGGCVVVAKFRAGEEGRYGLSIGGIRSKNLLENPRHRSR
jgi:hypothetical protein